VGTLTYALVSMANWVHKSCSVSAKCSGSHWGSQSWMHRPGVVAARRYEALGQRSPSYGADVILAQRFQDAHPKHVREGTQ